MTLTIPSFNSLNHQLFRDPLTADFASYHPLLVFGHDTELLEIECRQNANGLKIEIGCTIEVVLELVGRHSQAGHYYATPKSGLRRSEKLLQGWETRCLKIAFFVLLCSKVVHVIMTPTSQCLHVLLLCSLVKLTYISSAYSFIYLRSLSFISCSFSELFSAFYSLIDV